jgi:hypothetical protein
MNGRESCTLTAADYRLGTRRGMATPEPMSAAGLWMYVPVADWARVKDKCCVCDYNGRSICAPFVIHAL